MTISVLAIGSELLDGRVLDSNSQFIAHEFNEEGLFLDKILTCDDDETQIIACLEFLSQTSTCIIVSGGLGPTTDDLTREAIASFVKSPLKKYESSFSRLKKLYEMRQRILDASNEKQAYFPENSTIIPNSVGTAEGFYLERGTLCIFSVPGVPNELKPMFFNCVLPEVLKRHEGRSTVQRAPLRVFGLPESLVGSKINTLKLPNHFSISYRATFPEIHVVIKSKDRAELNRVLPSVRKAVGEEFIFAEDEITSFPEALASLLIQKKLTIGLAESCTGGMLGMHLSATPGSSSYFLGGIVSYSNEVKIRSLHVSPETLKMRGAVSEETAIEMARGCRLKLHSSYGVSITGIAGPDGGTDEKPVGTFFVGISDGNTERAYKFFFKSDRHGIRRFAAYAAMDVLRRTIQGMPTWDYSTQQHIL